MLSNGCNLITGFLVSGGDAKATGSPQGYLTSQSISQASTEDLAFVLIRHN